MGALLVGTWFQGLFSQPWLCAPVSLALCRHPHLRMSRSSSGPGLGTHLPVLLQPPEPQGSVPNTCTPGPSRDAPAFLISAPGCPPVCGSERRTLATIPNAQHGGKPPWVRALESRDGKRAARPSLALARDTRARGFGALASTHFPETLRETRQRWERTRALSRGGTQGRRAAGWGLPGRSSSMNSRL